mgnify:CR=1 FL=1
MLHVADDTDEVAICYTNSAGVVKQLPLGGGGDVANPMTTDLAAGGNKITGLADPGDPQDAATKAYVLANAGSTGNDFVVLADPAGGDDTVRLQAALDDCIADGRTLVLDGPYLLTAPLTITGPVSIRGPLRSGSPTLVGGDIVPFSGYASIFIHPSVVTPIACLFEISGNSQVSFLRLQLSGVNGLPFGSPRKAVDIILINGCGTSTFDDLSIGGAIRDGVHFGEGGGQINDRCRFTSCVFAQCGTLYTHPDLLEPRFHHRTGVDYYPSVTYVCTVVESTGILTSAAASFVTWGVRKGDPIEIGLIGGLGIVESVESETSLTLYSVTSGDVTDAPFGLAIGCGWFEERSGDNNIHLVTNSLFRGCAAQGLVMWGLYGHTVIACQFDYILFNAIRIGMTGGAPTLDPCVIRCYFEGIGRRDFVFGSVLGLTIISPTNSALESAADFTAGNYPWEFINGAASVTGFYTGRAGFWPIGDALQAESYVTARTVGNFFAGSSSYALFRPIARAVAPNGPSGYGYVPGGDLTALANVINISSEAGSDTAISGLAASPGGSPDVTLIGQGPHDILLTADATLRMTTPTLALGLDDVIRFVYSEVSGVWIEISRNLTP